MRLRRILYSTMRIFILVGIQVWALRVRKMGSTFTWCLREKKVSKIRSGTTDALCPFLLTKEKMCSWGGYGKEDRIRKIKRCKKSKEEQNSHEEEIISRLLLPPLP